MNYTEDRPICVFDTECYRNYWSIAFKDIQTGEVRRFRMTEAEDLNRKAIANIFYKRRVIGFNSQKYDMPMIALAMSEGTTCAALKRANDDLIVGGLPHWKAYEQWGVSLPDYIDHIDLMEVSPGAPQKLSLKLSGGRLHTRRMQDLPFDPDKILDPDEIVTLEAYHDNDLDVTEDLYRELKAQIDLRASMSEQYSIDLRSRSDAQIAEALLKAEIEKITGRRIYKPDVEARKFFYQVPPWMSFETAQMQEVLEQCRSLPFAVNAKGVVEMPAFLAERHISIGQSVYRMGIGGLHSSEESITHVADDEYLILDRDVTSYYPSTILQLGLAPKHLGKPFLDVYRTVFVRRLAAKKKGQELKAAGKKDEARHWENVAETLKIVLNGSFGKLGQPYSVLYAPELMLQVTLTGQLAILMLIERLEAAGISVISANTDGIVSKVPKGRRRASFLATVTEWEWDTGYGTEETEYTALHSRDVNAYIAVTPKGDVKLKGAFAPCGPGLKGAMGLKKNPAAEIASEAAWKFLAHGTPIAQTINECQDIRKFIVVRRVTGGAVDQDGDYVGKAIRWYYSEFVTAPLTYKKDGKNVPRSLGAKPLMEMPDECPDDIDRDWYIREAHAILQDVGYGTIDPDLSGKTGTFFGRRERAKIIHTVDAKTGIALCGNERDSIRESWVRYQAIPLGSKTCPRCRKAGEL